MVKNAVTETLQGALHSQTDKHITDVSVKMAGHWSTNLSRLSDCRSLTDIQYWLFRTWKMVGKVAVQVDAGRL